MKAGNACASEHCGIRPLTAAGAVCQSQHSERAVLQAFIKTAFKFGGAEINRLLFASNFCARIVRIIVRGLYDLALKIDTDIRMFAANICEYVYNAVIVAVEPLPKAHTSLEKAVCNGLGRHVAPRGELSTTSGLANIDIRRWTMSSSLLPIKILHEVVAPGFECFSAGHLEARTPHFMSITAVAHLRSIFFENKIKRFGLIHIMPVFILEKTLYNLQISGLFVHRRVI